MENGGRQISKVTLYACGTCKNNVASVFKGEKKREVIFPALVAKFEHVRYGTILFDTGYSKRVFENGIVSKLYNLLNPTSVSEEETITYKMKAEGCTVSNIILSHPHPDHIGCLKDFSNYTLIATGDCIDELKRAKTFELVFKNQVPSESSDIKFKTVEAVKNVNDATQMLTKHFVEIYDIFDDGSIYGIRLDGHMKGQMGVYLPEYKLMLAADASWGHFFAERVDKMKPIPRKIQGDYQQYKDSIARIMSFENEHPEVKVIYSHEEFKEGIYEQ